MSALSMTQAPQKPVLPDDIKQQYEQHWYSSDDPEYRDYLENGVRPALEQHYSLPTPDNSLGTQLMEGVHKVGQTLDWPFGILRAGVAASPVGTAANAASQILQGKKLQDMQPLVRPQDAVNAVKGPFGPGANGFSTYYKRLGVPDNAGENNFAAGSGIPLASILGFGSDAATSMLPEIDGAGAVNKIMRPLSDGTDALSSGWYKGGLRDELKTVTNYGGKEPEEAADWMMNNRVSGSKGSMLKQIESINTDNRIRQGMLHDQGNAAGADQFFNSPTMGLKTTAPLQYYINKMENLEPGSTGGLQGVSDFYKNLPQESFDEIVARNQYLNKKVNAGKGIGPDALTDTSRQGYQTVAASRAQHLEDSMNAAGDRMAAATGNSSWKGLGDRLDQTNNELSMGLATKDAIDNTKSYWHAPDQVEQMLAAAGLVGGGAAHLMGGAHGLMGPGIAAALLAAKRGGEWALGPEGRTTLGLLGKDAASLGLPDALARTGLKDTPDPDQNPWRLLPPNQTLGGPFR